MIEPYISTIPDEAQPPKAEIFTRFWWVQAALEVIDEYVKDAAKHEMERELFWYDYQDSTGDLDVILSCKLTMRTIYRIYGGGEQWNK